MANFPNTGFEDEMGVMMAIASVSMKFSAATMGVGAMTDLGPLIANRRPCSWAQQLEIGVFVALAGAMVLGFTAIAGSYRHHRVVTARRDLPVLPTGSGTSGRYRNASSFPTCPWYR